ncbi:MAG: hypothetical protein K6D94_09465 [Clostridiales bacterium]|nr:hypothetical protein [Clostridiales bacterium]
MRSDTLAERFGILDTCVTFECRYTYDEFASMREKGYTGVIFGYLDANWDGDFSRLDNYGRTSVFPDMIPADYIENNRKELSRRLECAKRAGLKVWMSVRGPLTGTDLRAISPETEEKYRGYFGPGGDKWGGSGMRPMCLSFPQVRQRYRELTADIVRSFPDIDGFTFFGGDSYSLVCDETCERCGSRPCHSNWSGWITELKECAAEVRDNVEFNIMNWPWWDDMFEIAEETPADISFMVIPNWGAEYSGDGDSYPAAVEPWECQECQSDALRVPTKDHKTALALTQHWINAPVTDRFRRFAGICSAQGRKLYAWCDLTTAEAVLPYFTPYPATALSRLRSFAEVGACGLVDAWGIPADNICGRHTDANTVLMNEFLSDMTAEGDVPLRRAAARLYGKGTEDDAVEAWTLIDKALARWPVVAYSQRMHWTLRRLWPDQNKLFYVFDLTLPYFKRSSSYDPCWPDFLYDPEVWKNMKKHLGKVIDLYDRALGAYERICLAAERNGRPDLLENARFHRDCATLTRCYFMIAFETCDYHIAGLNGQKLSEEYIRQAVGTRRLCRTLYTKLNVTPYENDMSRALANMSVYRDGDA